jgi:hypothetical protein
VDLVDQGIVSPEDVDVVALNDVDTKVQNIWAALKYFDFEDVDLVFAKVSTEGPTKSFNILLDLIRKKLLVTANGELMFVRRKTLMAILPIKLARQRTATYSTESWNSTARLIQVNL